jgi:hypothetical protein
MIHGRADPVVGASAAFMVVSDGFVIMNAAFMPVNAALAVVRAVCVVGNFKEQLRSGLGRGKASVQFSALRIRAGRAGL